MKNLAILNRATPHFEHRLASAIITKLLDAAEESGFINYESEFTSKRNTVSGILYGKECSFVYSIEHKFFLRPTLKFHLYENSDLNLVSNSDCFIYDESKAFLSSPKMCGLLSELHPEVLAELQNDPVSPEFVGEKFDYHRTVNDKIVFAKKVTDVFLKNIHSITNEYFPIYDTSDASQTMYHIYGLGKHLVIFKTFNGLRIENALKFVGAYDLSSMGEMRTALEAITQFSDRLCLESSRNSINVSSRKQYANELVLSKMIRYVKTLHQN